MLNINTVSTKWSDDLPGGLTWYFIGQPKSGKTTQASSWSPKGSEGVIGIDTDLGADFVDRANVVTCCALNPPVRTQMKDGIAVTKNGQSYEIVPTNEKVFIIEVDQIRINRCMSIH